MNEYRKIELFKLAAGMRKSVMGIKSKYKELVECYELISQEKTFPVNHDSVTRHSNVEKCKEKPSRLKQMRDNGQIKNLLKKKSENR